MRVQKFLTHCLPLSGLRAFPEPGIRVRKHHSQCNILDRQRAAEAVSEFQYDFPAAAVSQRAARRQSANPFPSC